MKFAKSMLGLVLAVLLCVSMARAQENAELSGTVTDPTGAVIPNAKVTITNVATGESRTVTSNGAGLFDFSGLNHGTYNMKVEAEGFNSFQRSNIVMNVAQTVQENAVLQVGAGTQTVTVEADTLHLQTETNEVSNLITGQQMTQLATNGRNMVSLTTLGTGVSNNLPSFNGVTAQGSGFGLSFNGMRPDHNDWLIDGGEAYDRGSGGKFDLMPSMDVLAEFQTLSSNYSPDYGISSGGTVTMVLKSGTKQFHGGLWEFNRNDAFDSDYFFAKQSNTPTPELRLNIFGGDIGGPVFIPGIYPKSRSKTFFFESEEWRRFIQGGIFNVTTPLASMYPDANGTGTGVVLPSTLSNGNPLNVVVPANIANLDTGCSGAVQASLVPGSSFPNNTIPDCAVNPNATALLSAGIFPAPTNTSTWTFIGGNKQPTTGKEELARVDHQFNDKFSIFGHWISDQAIQTYGTTQWSGDNVPTVFNTFGNPSYSAVIHATHAIRANLLNEIAFSYDGNRIHILPQGVYQQPSGFTEGANKIFSGENVDNRIPDINLSGSTNTHYTVNWLPWNNTANDYQVRDDLSWVRGAHQLKFGFSWAIYKKAQDYFAETQGGFTFNGSATSPAGCTNGSGVTCGLDYADFILGDAQAYNENAYKGTGHWTAISPAAYIQDNWRATHRLTLNLGLRWDGIPHTYEANYNQSNFYPSQYNSADAPTWVPGTSDGQICGGTPLPAGCAAASPGLGTSPIPVLSAYQFYLNGMGIGGKNGNPRGLADNAWWNFGPRIGFAYDVTGSGKTVIRGGFGLMYERIQGNDMYNGATNPPFGYSLGTNNVLFSDPHFTWSGGQITVPIVPAGVVGINQSYPAPRTSSYSAGVQQAVGSKAVFSVSYVGTRDRHESYWQELNLPPVGDLACLQAKANCTGAQPAFNGDVPYQGYNSIKQAYDGANSHYNSLQTELRGRITRDLTLQAAYTLSRAIDPTTGQNSGNNGWDLSWVTNPYVGWRYDVGPSVLDRTSIAFFNFVYDIPSLRNSPNRFLKTAVGGWQLSGIITAQSGAPENLSINGQNVSSIFPGGDVNNRPDLSGALSYPKTRVVSSSGAVTGIQWVNPAAFSAPAPGTWGNFGFDGVRGPGRDNWNLSLFKNFVINEARGSSFQFRAESFNTWNHTQFGGSGQNGGFSNNFGAGNFGQVTSAFDPRVFQLGAKLIF